jgi:hypothetical protein
MSVDSVAPTNPQVAQKNLHILDMLPMSGKTGIRDEIIEFHNPTKEPRKVELVFDLRALPNTAEVAFRFTPLLTTTSLEEAIHGAKPLRQTRGEKQHLVEQRRHGLLRKLPDFEPTIYVAERKARVTLTGVELPPLGSVAAELMLQLGEAAHEGGSHRVQVLQIHNGRVVGGSDYVLREGPAKLPINPKAVIRESDQDHDSDEFEPFVPPWLRAQVLARRQQSGRNLGAAKSGLG